MLKLETKVGRLSPAPLPPQVATPHHLVLHFSNSLLFISVIFRNTRIFSEICLLICSRKSCSGNMQQIYSRTPMQCDFTKDFCKFTGITFPYGCSPVSLQHIFRKSICKSIYERLCLFISWHISHTQFFRLNWIHKGVYIGKQKFSLTSRKCLVSTEMLSILKETFNFQVANLFEVKRFASP